MDLVRFGKNVLFALALLAIIAAINEADLPATQRLEEYIAFVLTTELEYGPLVELGQNFTLFGEGAGFRNWWGRWRDDVPAVPAGAPAEPLLFAPGENGG